MPAGVPAFGDGPCGPSFPDTGRPHLDPSTRQDSRHLCRAFQADGPDVAWANRSAGRLAGYAEWAEPGAGGPLHAPASAGAAVRNLSAPGTRRLVPAERRSTPVDHSCRKEAHLPAGESSTSRPSTGSPCGPRIRSSRPSPPSGGGPVAPQPWPWSSSSSSPPNSGGGRAVNAPHLVPLPSSTFRATLRASSSSPTTCPGGAVCWSVRVKVGSIWWCLIGHFGLMVVTVFRWVAHLSGERWATPAVRRWVVRVGVSSLCPGVQAVIRFAYSGAVRRGPRWEFLGGPLS